MAPLIPRPRYLGVRRLADVILDAIFGQPLRRLQEFFRDRHVRRARRDLYTAQRQDRIQMRNFDSFLYGPIERARQARDQTGFVANLRWLLETAPDVARRYTGRMREGELDQLIDPRRPGNLALLNRIAPAHVIQRTASTMRQQMLDSWGLNPSDLSFGGSTSLSQPLFDDQKWGTTFTDDMFGERVKQGNMSIKRPRAHVSGSQHEAMDDYMRRMNPFGDRRGPIG